MKNLQSSNDYLTRDISPISYRPPEPHELHIELQTHAHEMFQILSIGQQGQYSSMMKQNNKECQQMTISPTQETPHFFDSPQHPQSNFGTASVTSKSSDFPYSYCKVFSSWTKPTRAVNFEIDFDVFNHAMRLLQASYSLFSFSNRESIKSLEEIKGVSRKKEKCSQHENERYVAAACSPFIEKAFLSHSPILSSSSSCFLKEPSSLPLRTKLNEIEGVPINNQILESNKPDCSSFPSEYNTMQQRTNSLFCNHLTPKRKNIETKKGGRNDNITVDRLSAGIPMPKEESFPMRSFSEGACFSSPAIDSATPLSLFLVLPAQPLNLLVYLYLLFFLFYFLSFDSILSLSAFYRHTITPVYLPVHRLISGSFKMKKYDKFS